MFSVFSVYTVLSYGFQYFCTPDYTIVGKSPDQKMKVGEVVTLMCKADNYWEWCRWVHMSSYCEWEWTSSAEGVSRTGCSLDEVQRVGNYSAFECGLRFTVRPQHRGVWLCELEKYHFGFMRR